ncbi:MAG: tyrosine-type recombinase/integrase [Acutalibacteraceae bacterium]
MTIQSALDDFLVDQQIRGNARKTLEYYRLSVGFYVRFMGDSTTVQQITLDSLKRYYLTLFDRPISTVTIQTYIRALRAFLTWCYQQEYIPVNLSEKFRLPKAKRKAIDVLTDDEVRRLLACFNPRYLLQLRNLCICSLMLDSGLRLHEVSTLSLGHLHLSDGYLIVDGKGNKQRIVPIGLYSRRYLSRYIARRPSCAVSDRVFLCTDLDPIADGTIRSLFRKLKARASIPRLRPHLLRHTFATRFLENGGDMYTLQQILGHTSLEMVKKYVHSTHRKTVVRFPEFSPLDNLL